MLAFYAFYRETGNISEQNGVYVILRIAKMIGHRDNLYQWEPRFAVKTGPAGSAVQKQRCDTVALRRFESVRFRRAVIPARRDGCT